MTLLPVKKCHSGLISFDFSGVAATIFTPHATRHTPHPSTSLRAPRHSDNIPKKSAADFLCFHEMPITTGVADLFRTPVFAFADN
jgi:hypothetical protein